MRLLTAILRRFRRAPAFTAIALITIAIGIGANTAVFSVVNGVLIKPLPYPDSDELLGVWHTAPGAGIDEAVLSPSQYFVYRDQNRTFRDFGVWSGGAVAITGTSEPEQVRSVFVTHGVLDAFAVQPALGRVFTQEDDTPGSAETILLTHGYWQRRFGGDASIVGRSLTVDFQPRTVIGVMPPGFRFLDTDAEVILPQRFDRSRVSLGNFSFQGIARLRPGVTLEQASADVARMIPTWLQTWPTPPGFDRKLFENARFAPALRGLKRDVVGDIGDVLWVLMGTIGVVLLMACANVANLLLVRVEGRQQELATRAALGAGWSRIARELLRESLALGLLGGALGLGLAYAALRVLVAIGPETLPRLHEISIDPLVLAFTLAASLLSGLLFGAIPVLKYSGPRIANALRGAGRTSSHSRERHRTRNTLVVLQVALALILLVAAGLMIRTFQTLRAVQPGFTRPQAVQMARVSVPQTLVPEPGRVARTHHEIVEKLSALPGVTAAAFASSAPIEGFNSNDPVFPEDKTYALGQLPPIRRFKFVSPGYFAAVGTPLVTGRDITWADIYDERPVTVISEGIARELWREPAAALGKRIRVGGKDAWAEIVGVAGDVYDNGVHEPAPAIVYWPVMMPAFRGNPQFVQRSVSYLVRSDRAGTQGLIDQMRQAVWSVNGSLPIALVRTLGDVYARSMARTSFALTMLGIAGAMALLLGIVGIYGVISYAVSQRTREIGIRIALGVGPGELQGMFLRYGLTLAGIGVVVGLGAAAGVTRLMSTLLFRTSPLDPLTYSAVAGTLVLAAVTASYLPARRASALDPVEALRAE